jgi:ribosomal protein S18 acetylase RimI-like enzyme
MHEPLQVVVEDKHDPVVIHAVVKALSHYNASKADGEMPHYVVLSVRDAAGEIVGGLVGATYLGWLQVQALWVDDALRGQGVGTRLLRQAEAVAIERGILRVFLETLSFQALPFYEKLGYEVVSTIADFPPGGARYALTRMLA